MNIVLATRNRHKIDEIQTLLQEMNIRVLSLQDFPGLPDVVEDRETFTGNAEKKAVEIAQFTGMMALGDDSGLCVDALDGAPGVYSARFAGEPANDAKNNQKLLRLLDDTPVAKRTAHFVCVMSLATPEQVLHTVEGRVNGQILYKPRGQNGFGYDPLFYYPPYDATFAEIPPAKKNAVSHRANALKLMVAYIRQMPPNPSPR
ncbi:MAG: XTP/dITP diphosphatase [Gemmatimonadetes bacterium]|nr:MAG: XTP/dITP diphosphatase [Gemmatimonadota bacterium]